MTPSELSEYARQQYNSLNDDFFTDAELYRHIWAAQAELARKALVIERTYTASSVASQAEYEYPTNTIAIKRVTYNSSKLMPISFREYDSLVQNTTTVPTGTPQYYFVWQETMTLYPTPDTSSYTIKVWSYNEPQEVSVTSTLEVPSLWHLPMADYLCWKKATKDKNLAAAQLYKDNWDQAIIDAKAWQRKRLRGDSFSSVTDLDVVPITVVGAG